VLGDHFPPGRTFRVRGFHLATIALAAILVVGAFAAPASAAKNKSKAKAATTTTAPPTLATLKVQAAAVTVKPNGATAYVAAKDGQVLRQGDAIKTDTAGRAEIDYTDGSLTRLGASTEFTISKLTNNQGGRQTEGTLTVGDTWSRAAKVSETSSFDVKAGGTTAAVTGTAFAFTCTLQSGQLNCTVTAVVDTVTVTGTNNSQVALTPATQIGSIGGNLGSLVHLTYDDLSGNVFIAGNLLLDQQAGKGNGLADIPPPPTPTTQPPAGGGQGGGQPTVTQQDVTPAPTQYPPNGGITVDQPTITPGGTETFRGTGCQANETLTVLFDGTVIGTITANANGDFAGSVTIPKTAAPGTHTLTVKGSVCVLNATITVSGALAFTGSSSHTSTYVLLGIAAIMVGMVLVVGARRRRRGHRAAAARGSP
jgi:LPXTG-motif cell wall-anchored protein